MSEKPLGVRYCHLNVAWSRRACFPSIAHPPSLCGDGGWHSRCKSRSIHAIRKSTMPRWRSSGMSVPRGTFHHFARQLRQQVAVACWATNTGCPRIGVCFPSLGGFAGARRVRTKSAAWQQIVCRPFSAMYRLSASERWNRLRNLDRASRANADSCCGFISQ